MSLELAEVDIINSVILPAPAVPGGHRVAGELLKVDAKRLKPNVRPHILGYVPIPRIADTREAKIILAMVTAPAMLRAPITAVLIEHLAHRARRGAVDVDEDGLQAMDYH